MSKKQDILKLQNLKCHKYRTEVACIMGWKCIIAGGELTDIRQDRKESVRIEQYAVSERAVYFQGSYLPLKNVKAVRMLPSVYRPNHCCGIGIPVTKVRIDYGGEKPLVLMLEKEENAERICAAICAGNPEAAAEKYPDPGIGK